VLRQTRDNKEKFVWDRITSLDELGRLRLEAMSDFLNDYELGKKDGRYIAAELPYLPFAPTSFDIVLCSHLLFFYSDSLSLAFHQQAVDELCRVAREVRIFPILTYNADPSPLVAPIAEHAKRAGRIVSIERVQYEFQRGGNLMMKVLDGTGV
jgi:SAM-dependent methyltransferase